MPSLWVAFFHVLSLFFFFLQLKTAVHVAGTFLPKLKEAKTNAVGIPAARDKDYLCVCRLFNYNNLSQDLHMNCILEAEPGTRGKLPGKKQILCSIPVTFASGS